MVSENNYLLNPIIHYVQFYYPLVLLEELTYLKKYFTLSEHSAQHVVSYELLRAEKMANIELC